MTVPVGKQGTQERRESAVARRMVINSIGNAAPIAAAVLTAPILAHGLGVTSRGDVAAATGPFLLASSCATLGIPDALTFYLARRIAALRRAVIIGLVMTAVSSTVVAGIIIGLAPLLSDGQASVEHLIVIGGLAVIPALGVAVLRGAAAGLHQWSDVRRERVIGAVARLVGILALFAAGDLTVLTATIVIVLSPTVGGIAYLRLVSSTSYQPAEATTDGFRYVAGFSEYGWRVWVGAVSGILLARLDQAIMNPLSGPRQLGLYTVAVSVGELPLIISAAMREVMFSEQSRAKDKEQLTRAARVSFLLCAAFGALLIASMPLWFTIAFGSGFRAAEASTVILLVAVVIGTPGSIAGSGLSGHGMPGRRSGALVVACAANVLMLVLLVPRFGSVGAAWATLGGNLVASSLAVILMGKAASVRVREFYAVSWEDVSYVFARLPLQTRSRLVAGRFVRERRGA